MHKFSQLTRTSFMLAFLFSFDKVLAFIKSLLFNKVVGLEGMGIFGASYRCCVNTWIKKGGLLPGISLRG
jgi:hypothetical protein